MLGEPRRRPCWRGPQLLLLRVLPPGLIFLMIYSWLLIFSSLPGRTQADHEDVPTHNSSATATATATALAPINSSAASNSCRPEAAAAAAAASCDRGAHSNSSLNGSDWTPNPGIAVSLSLALEQELGSNPFVKLLPPRVSLSLSLSVFGEMKTNPFGFVIKLPLGQPEAEQQQPLDHQEQLLKHGASQSQPQANAGSSSDDRGWHKCSYTVTIKTTCSSPRVTRDAISLVFGDAYRNEVYAARLDDPATGTFERCSIDTFRVAGPCGDRTCYLYLRRSGRDGWTPEYVKVFYSPGDSRAAVTFFYKAPLPEGVWYGYNLCHGGGAVAAATTTPSTAAFNLLEGTGRVGLTENDMPDAHRITTTTGRPTLIIG